MLDEKLTNGEICEVYFTIARVVKGDGTPVKCAEKSFLENGHED